MKVRESAKEEEEGRKRKGGVSQGGRREEKRSLKHHGKNEVNERIDGQQHSTRTSIRPQRWRDMDRQQSGRKGHLMPCKHRHDRTWNFLFFSLVFPF